MLLMDSLAYHEPLVRSPALGPLCSWKLAGTPPPPIFPELLGEHHLLRKSNLALANAASFSLLEWCYHENLFFLLFLILFHGETENQGDAGRIWGTFRPEHGTPHSGGWRQSSDQVSGPCCPYSSEGDQKM